MNKYFDKKIVDWWIEDLVNWCDEQDNGGGAGGLTDEGLVSLTGHYLSEWFIFSPNPPNCHLKSHIDPYF